MLIRFVVAGCIPFGTSSTITSGQKAVSLNTTGMYSLVRHPLYLGNFLIWFGLACFTGLWWFILLIACLFCLFYERIMVAEENFLAAGFGEEFLTWAEETPAFIPRFRGWRPPPLPFSFRAALRREYGGFAAVILGFYALTLLGTLVVEGRIYAGKTATLAAVFTVIAYFALRYLKKHTNLLQVAGR
jgi:protein-S-isoprenylcysteine O-methyltransferase Ste14